MTDRGSPATLFWTARRDASVARAESFSGDAWRLGGVAVEGWLAGHGLEGRGADRRRPELGGALWTPPCRDRHPPEHARIGISVSLNNQGSKKKMAAPLDA